MTSLLENKVAKELHCDVCVIGAGAAGAYASNRLADSGLKVILLDAGGRQAKLAEDAGFDVDFGVETYLGATLGRAFGLGGTTSRWGGLLAPHSQQDLRPPNETSWDRIVADVQRESATVLAALGVRKQFGFEQYPRTVIDQSTERLEKAGVVTIGSLFLPFRKKNFRSLLRKDLPALTVITDAVATDWLVSERAIDSVVAKSRSDQAVRVSARYFIVATGAIESARILLEIRNDHPHLLKRGNSLGQCLGDHLSIPIADVEQSDVRKTQQVYGPRFDRGWMRSFRFSDKTDHDGPRCFAHFVFDIENPGFALAKDVLCSLQARRLPQSSVKEMGSGLYGVTQIAIARFLQNRLYLPPTTPVRLQLDMEQPRDQANQISLSDRRDAFGRKKVIVDWQISHHDLELVEAQAHRFLSKWRNAGLIELRPRKIGAHAEKPHDAYHPVGVCKMGSEADAAVDLDLTVKGTSNLSVLSTGVLPTAGTANPTFTLLCLGESLVQRLKAKLLN